MDTKCSWAHCKYVIRNNVESLRGSPKTMMLLESLQVRHQEHNVGPLRGCYEFVPL